MSAIEQADCVIGVMEKTLLMHSCFSVITRDVVWLLQVGRMSHGVLLWLCAVAFAG